MYIQIIGFIAYGFLLSSYWNNKKEKLLKYRTIGNLIMAIHYLLLKGITGFVTSLITAFRGYVYNNKDKKIFSNSIWVWIFIIIYILIAYFTYDGWVSLLPVFACVIVSVTLWKDNLTIIRLTGILESVCWFVYGFSNGSTSAVIIETILIISTVLALIKNKNNTVKGK